MNRGIYDWVRGNNASRKELAIGTMRLQFSAKNYARKKKNKNLEYNEKSDVIKVNQLYILSII